MNDYSPYITYQYNEMLTQMRTFFDADLIEKRALRAVVDLDLDGYMSDTERMAVRAEANSIVAEHLRAA